MHYIRRSDERGTADFGWLKSKHSFSFGRYYDPLHMGISVLRVINDDHVMPGQGFGEHGHRDMEIISYVTEGALQHEDSTGNKYVVPAGDVQRMSAGRGVTHSEFNASKKEPVKFFQIWIEPNVKGIVPEYEQKSIAQNGPLTTLVHPQGAEGALQIHQDASVSRLVLEKGERFRLQADRGVGYLHLVAGQLEAQGKTFLAGDAFAFDHGKALEVSASEASEALWFDLPKSH